METPYMHTQYTNTDTLETFLRGMETSIPSFSPIPPGDLETFLRGMETFRLRRDTSRRASLETFLRGMETLNVSILPVLHDEALKPSLEGWKLSIPISIFFVVFTLKPSLEGWKLYGFRRMSRISLP